MKRQKIWADYHPPKCYAKSDVHCNYIFTLNSEYRVKWFKHRIFKIKAKYFMEI